MTVEQRAVMSKASYQKNKPARDARSKEWARNNPERRREIVRVSDSKRKDKTRVWCVANADILRIKKALYRDKNKERIKAHVRQYKKLNKDKINADCAYRRAVKRGAEGRYTKKDVDALWEQQRGICAACKADLYTVGKHVDHKIALSRGGSNWPKNIQLLCPTCNLRKHVKSMEAIL